MITIESNTSIEEIDTKWFANGKDVQFILKADSSFQLFAESYAIAALRQLSENDRNIKVFIPDSEKLNNLLSGKTSFLDHSALSIFGLQLIFVSKFVAFQSNQVKNIRSELGNSIWSYLLSTNMTIGSGRRTQYVSNHTHPVPKAFGGERKIGRYASYQSFKAEISKCLASAWGGSDGLSEYHIDKIVGVAFHASENSYDHARSDKETTIRGYYGLTLEKLIFESLEGIEVRKELPNLLRNYLAENFQKVNLGTARKLKVQVVTISDIGNGIQNTLFLKDGMAAQDIVKAAFNDLVTSKIKNNDDEQPGFGLGDIVSLARDLNSLLYIQSGDYEFYQDFSDMPERMTEDQKRKVQLTILSPRKKKYGTCLSLVWIVQSDKTQPGLFDGGE